jgi:hypothetical protein
VVARGLAREEKEGRMSVMRLLTSGLARGEGRE